MAKTQVDVEAKAMVEEVGKPPKAKADHPEERGVTWKMKE